MSGVVTAAAAGDAPRRGERDSATAVVRASGLPAELGALVLSVTGKCRLWKSERTDVARELCSHFLEGIDAGAMPSELAASFGDSRDAARLITAAKKRQRPLWWRAARRIARAAGAVFLLCLVVYAVLAGRFFLGRPTIRHNYMQEWNAPVLATAESERAWPLYIRAMREFGRMPEFMLAPENPDPRRPGDVNWDRMSEWLDGHKAAMATVRRAAARPMLGYVYQSDIEPEYGRALEAMNDGYKYAPSLGRRPQNPLAMGVSLPYLGEMGKFGRWLDADAHRAAEQGDSARFVADVDALLGMVGQCLQQKFIISTLNGLHWADVAAGAILEECEHPDLLDNGQLRALAHGLGGLGGGRIRIDASNERIAIDDIVQRFFSDDGHGDGRFVASPEMDAFCEDYGIAKPKAYVFLQAIQPLKSAIIPNRAAINERADRFAAAAALDDSLPLWRHDERSSDKEWNALMGSGVYTVFPAIRVLYEGFGDSPIAFACGARDIVEAKRDAALTVLALVAFQREHGAWPARLDELVPSFLPRVPVDPFDGHPMQYRGPTKEGGRPLLYSVGVDGTDQGGISPTTLEGWYGVHNLHWIAKFRHPQPMAAAERQQMDAVRGDWVLWPVPAKVAEGDGVKGGGAR